MTTQDMIEKYYPGYSKSDEILKYDILHRLLNSEPVSGQDKKYLLSGKPSGMPERDWFQLLFYKIESNILKTTLESLVGKVQQLVHI
jgi:hypothetical protein